MKLAQALWHLSPTQSALLPTPIVALPLGLSLQAQYSLISNGTERLVASGGVPPDLTQSMQVPYQEGSFDFPVKYGYSLVARVEQKSHPWQHRLVHLLHPHQDRAVVAETDVFLIPPEIPALRATLASNLETAVNAIWEVPVSIGDRVLVAGFGIIGSLVARLLSAFPGIDLQVLEKDPSRRQLAEQMGFLLQEPEKPGKPFDFAYHTTASATGLQYCIDHLGFEGKVMELSWYGQQKVALQLGAGFHQQRQQIISTQVGQLPSMRRGRWDYARRKTLVFDLLKNPVFDQHITRVIPFSEAPVFFNQLRKEQPEGLGVVIDYGKGAY